MHWVDDYIGLPFEHDGRTRQGCDCWGLVFMVYRDRHGIELPDFVGASGKNGLAAMRRAHKAIEVETAKWIQVETPQPFDVAMFRRNDIERHVGIVIDPVNMLHISAGIKSTIDPYHGMQYGRQLMGFYRYAR